MAISSGGLGINYCCCLSFWKFSALFSASLSRVKNIYEI
jgi:hypothetical protein